VQIKIAAMPISFLIAVMFGKRYDKNKFGSGQPHDDIKTN